MTSQQPDLVGIEVASPVGGILAVVTDSPGLTVVALGLTVPGLSKAQDVLARLSAAESARYRGQSRVASPVESALRRYFEGDVGALDTLPVEQPGGPFRQAAWAAMRGIAAGDRWAYSELAAAAGRPAAVRAAGTACATNRVPLLVPCHRVVRSDGSLGNYFYGTDVKQWLLRHEGGRDA